MPSCGTIYTQKPTMSRWYCDQSLMADPDPPSPSSNQHSHPVDSILMIDEIPESTDIEADHTKKPTESDDK